MPAPGAKSASRSPACSVMVAGGRMKPVLGLLDLDGAAGFLELGLELLGLFLLDALLDGLGRLVDDRLGLLEAQARGRADDLDDLDLLVARGREDDVEGALLLLGRGAVAAPGACAGGRRGRDGLRRHAEPLLERLD